MQKSATVWYYESQWHIAVGLQMELFSCKCLLLTDKMANTINREAETKDRLPFQNLEQRLNDGDACDIVHILLYRVGGQISISVVNANRLRSDIGDEDKTISGKLHAYDTFTEGLGLLIMKRILRSERSTKCLSQELQEPIVFTRGPLNAEDGLVETTHAPCSKLDSVYNK